MSNDCYVCRFECEWFIFCLCMFLGVTEFWTSTISELDVLETQVSEFMALHRSKFLVQSKRYQGSLLILSNSTPWKFLTTYTLKTIAWVRSRLFNLFLLLCGSKFTLTIKPFILIHTLQKKPSRTFQTN